MLKDLEQKRFLKGKDVAENFAQWFDELYLGKYDLIPYFQVNKLSDEKFELKVHIKNRQNGETILIDDLYHKEKIWDLDTEDIGKIVEKQFYKEVIACYNALMASCHYVCAWIRGHS